MGPVGGKLKEEQTPTTESGLSIDRPEVKTLVSKRVVIPFLWELQR